MNENELERMSLKIRQKAFRMACRANGGHIAPAFSIAEIISVLYFGGVLKYKSDIPDWNERDYFILSKGHGVLALYATLNMAGFFKDEVLDDFCRPGGSIGSLAVKGSVPGIEASTGSLGHGLSYAIGIALANKYDGSDQRTYVLLGDGECQEGSVWEGFLSAIHHQLSNLVIIIDNNGLQAMDSIENIMSFDKFSGKLKSLGFDVDDIDGHNIREIISSLKKVDSNRPHVIVAHTIKGKGISFMENRPIWHYRIPNEKEMPIALKELKMTEEDLGEYEKSLFRHII